MSPPEHVPEELWLEVFRHLPLDTLRDVSTTSHIFGRLSRPFLFSHLDFHPYATRPYARHGFASHVLLLPEAAEVERVLERLNFWSSAGIAPFVRSCSITTWRKEGPGPSIFSTTDSPDVLLYPFFERLACFTGLQQLNAVVVHFTQAAIANLCRLPALTEMHIDTCNVVGGLESQTLSISVLSIRHDVRREDGIGLWVPLLRPDRLHELDLMCNLRVLGVTIEDIPPFPNLHTLSMTINLSRMSDTIAILSKFPSLQVLVLTGWGRLVYEADPLVPASDILPALRRYAGPHLTLPIFLTCATLTHLTTHYCSPSDLMAQLAGTRTPGSITSLYASFDDLDTGALGTLCAFFPQLTELRIRILFVADEDAFEDPLDSKTTAFFSALAETPALPRALERLMISWKFEYEDTDVRRPSAGSVPEFATVRDALVARCSNLTAFWLDGDHFVFGWRRMLDGPPVEARSCHSAEAGQMRGNVAAFWDM
ncbi:hypothetical protein DFH07DRAFT_798134 [Mycena maculata]|uniref:F-box domain-containing protein n=1 Tax=Mycena maculata TaxID=230809 RepID=A0AAD7NVQ2_9AGAR|nr:hypothetical protein DFH07DRAFT_798134 [Mycena maculata]